jgi:two-component system LytT family response regulator
MRPIRVLIVDDEPAARAAIRHLLGTDRDVDIVAECRNGRDAQRMLAAGDVDLVFLDVQMPVMDGLTVAASMDTVAPPVIVFVTAFDRYAVKAFEVHAVDYLLKPFTDERFYSTVERVKRIIRRGRQDEVTQRIRSLLDEHGPAAAASDYLRRLALRTGERVALVPVSDVDWIEAEGDYVCVHIGPARHLMRDTMQHLAASLDPARFARIHRSTIVNLDRVRELRALSKGEFAVVLHDDTELKLSRSYKDPLERQLGRRL